MNKSEVNKHWNFWKDIVLKKDGTIHISQVKKELADFSFILDQVPKVYCHITGSMLSKPNYYADDVIRAADDHYQKQHKEEIVVMFGDMKREKFITKKTYGRLMEWLDNYL